MKFPRFYNPFRRIRELEASIDNLTSSYEDRLYYFKSVHESLSAQVYRYAKLTASMGKNQDDLEQAIEAFMDEREELKLAIDVRHQVNVMLLKFLEKAYEDAQVDDAALSLAAKELGDLDGALTSAQAQIDRMDSEATTQAEEIVETIAYLKQVEAALEHAGITIGEDEDCNPVVVINERAFMSAISSALSDGEGTRVLPKAA